MANDEQGRIEQETRADRDNEREARTTHVSGRFRLVEAEPDAERDNRIAKLANDAMVTLTGAKDPADVLNATAVLVVSVLRSAKVPLESFQQQLSDLWAGTEGPHQILPLRRDS